MAASDPACGLRGHSRIDHFCDTHAGNSQRLDGSLNRTNRVNIPMPRTGIGRVVTLLIQWVLVGVSTCAALTCAASAEQLTLVRPMESLSAESSEVVLRAVYQELGLDIVVEMLPAQLALERSTRGLSDGEVHRASEFGDHADMLVRVPTPLGYLRTVAVYRRDGGVSIGDLADLGGHRIARVAGMVHAANTTVGLDDVMVVPDLDAMMAAVASGEADVGVGSMTAIRVALTRLGLEGTMGVSAPLSTTTLHHYVNVRHSDLVPQVDAILARMTDDGILGRVQCLFEEEYFRQTINRH